MSDNTLATQPHIRYLVEEATANAVHLWEHNDTDTRTLEQVLDDVRADIDLHGVTKVLALQAVIYSNADLNR